MSQPQIRQCDRIWRNARLATMDVARGGAGIIENGVIAAINGRIAFVGPASEATALTSAEITDCEGRWITPGLIDPHTHIVYAGSRAHEFELRLQGASYEDIARAGGGIVSTMHATRAANQQELVDIALPRIDALMREGVTTVEIKSGYGLTLADELKMLCAAREIGNTRNIRVRTTLLAAHATPPEFKDNPDAYIALVCDEIIPVAAKEGLADAVDAFCEGIGFTPDQTRRVFEAARRHGLRVKLHAEQLSNQHGAALAAAFSALSADHLEHVDEDGVRAMAAAGVTAMLLPGAFYFTRERQLPPIDQFRAHGVPMALATDCNPGTSPMTSLLLALNMGATLFRLSVDECLAAVTRNAAKALGLETEVGTLRAGMACDLAIWDIERPAELVYRIGYNPLHLRVRNGR